MPADVQTPISLYLGFVGNKPGVLLESAEVDGRLGKYSLIAWDFKLLVGMTGGRLHIRARDERLKGLERLTGSEFVPGMKELLDSVDIQSPEGLGELPALTRGIYGYLGYGLGGCFEPKLAEVLPPESAEVRLALPGKVVLFDHLRHRCCLLTLDGNGEDVPEFDRSMVFGRLPETSLGEPRVEPGQEEYQAAVAKAKEMISQGEAIQVVLSTRFTAEFSGEPFSLYRRLRQVNPSPFMFFMRFFDEVLVGSSPELMVQSQKDVIEVRPIAGTRHRGADEAEDEALAEELLADPKERAEHVMLVDLGRNDLGRMAEPGTVEVSRFMQVERFSHVMHLTSYVEAQLKKGLDAMDVIVASFPAGTLSGAPKVRAMEIIAELESLDRGPYAGAIGWLGLGADKRETATGITIRSLWIRDGLCHWQAGAGIVYDSVPEKEWQECNNKARVLREILAGQEEGDVFADR